MDDLTREYERLRQTYGTHRANAAAAYDTLEANPERYEKCRAAMLAARDALDTFVHGLIEHHSTPDSTEACGCRFPDAYGCARYGGGSSCTCVCHTESRTQSSSGCDEVSRQGSRSEHRPVDPQTNPSSTEAGDLRDAIELLELMARGWDPTSPEHARILRAVTAVRTEAGDTARLEAENRCLREALQRIRAEAPTRLTMNEWSPVDVAELAADALHRSKHDPTIYDASAPDTARTPEVSDG